MWHELMLLTQ